MEWTGKFTNNTIAAFPYTLAAKDDQQIFDADCVPEDFVLGDPDHLPAPQIYALYNHWLDRQRVKLPAFVILNPGPHHQAAEVKSKKPKDKGKRKMEYVEVHTSDEDKEDEEGMENKGPSDEEDEVEEHISTPVKSGRRKGKKAGPSKPRGHSEDTMPVARPSSLPPPKRSPKNIAKARLAKNPSPKKRKADEDTDAPDEDADEAGNATESPRQSAKNANSAKRKADNELAPPPPKLLKTDRLQKLGKRPEPAPVEEVLAVRNPTKP